MIYFLATKQSDNVQFQSNLILRESLQDAMKLASSIVDRDIGYDYGEYNEDHPLVLWGRKSRLNYRWCVKYVEEISRELTYRFDYCPSLKMLNRFRSISTTTLRTSELTLTIPPIVFPKKYKGPRRIYRCFPRNFTQVIYLHRLYFMWVIKNQQHYWTKRGEPGWLTINKVT
jgi:hypothetical protein